ncbi:MAG: ATP-binding protein, partial [Mycoplasmataceae bacterium]|nr:ATP-binding protein [Mycoplasmataceae bacterium]
MDNQITHLTKVEIKGLWGKYDIVWDLNSDVNVLAGINGSGKTTILNYIYNWVFRKTIPLLSSQIVNETKIRLTFNNNIKFPEHLENPSKYMLNLKDCKLLNTINISLINTFDAEAKPQELLQKADRVVETELDWELWLLQQEYTKYQVRIYKTHSEVNRATHIRFLAIIDELFLETNKRVNFNKEELEFLLGDKEINAYQLSSGEKQLLIILLTVLIQDNKPSILLMDEPEISLHIEWQRKLIKYIRELNPNVQLIIATHSPDIIVHGWLDNVF